MTTMNIMKEKKVDATDKYLHDIMKKTILKPGRKKEKKRGISENYIFSNPKEINNKNNNY